MSHSHSFSVEVATQYNDIGLAVLINRFQYWIRSNKDDTSLCSEGHNFRDGHTWTYDTLEKIAASFPYFTVKQVRTLLDKAIEYGILKKGNYNDDPMRRTLWYAFVDEARFAPATPAPHLPKRAFRKHNFNEKKCPDKACEGTNSEKVASAQMGKCYDTLPYTYNNLSKERESPPSEPIKSPKPKRVSKFSKTCILSLEARKKLDDEYGKLKIDEAIKGRESWLIRQGHKGYPGSDGWVEGLRTWLKKDFDNPKTTSARNYPNKKVPTALSPEMEAVKEKRQNTPPVIIPYVPYIPKSQRQLQV